MSTLELTLAGYSEAKLLRAASALSGKQCKSLSLKQIQAAVDAGQPVDLVYRGWVPHTFRDGSALRDGQAIDPATLMGLGVGKVLVRWDRDRKVNALVLRSSGRDAAAGSTR